MPPKPAATAALIAATAITCMLLRRIERRIVRRVSGAGAIEKWEGEGGALAPERDAGQTSQVSHAAR